jgi:hypothetical protein
MATSLNTIGRYTRMMEDDPSFAIPVRPERTYPYSGGVEYEGETVFTLTPGTEWSNERLERLVGQVLAAGPYRYGDFRNLPMALYLVRDGRTGDVFRLSIRDSDIRLHVLPDTEPDGLRAMYDRLVARTDCDWVVECSTDEP